MPPSLKRKRGQKYQRGRKPRPWLQSALPPRHIRTYFYAKHLALMDALAPYVLADLQQRFELTKQAGRTDALEGYAPQQADRPDILLYALELAARKHKIDIEQTTNDYISEQLQQHLEGLILGVKARGDET